MSLQHAHEWHISKINNTCLKCQKVFSLEDVVHSCIIENEHDEGFTRSDYCDTCWGDLEKTNFVSSWKTHKLEDGKKVHRVIDKDMLFHLFDRMRQSDSDKNKSFAFLIGLVLMQKRVLQFEDVRFENGEEYMLLKRRINKDEFEQIELVDPKLSEEQTEALNEELSQLINLGDLQIEPS